ncbi:MAG: DUF47 domain-containing protein [Dehalobacter sp. 4CP]|uniref:DUF47 domain-containing protein n=1 Tax=Dehalobacter sp. CP TaxID=2594474 RepID=UPI0013CB15B7|nr:DUF47 domain-containing protein [Dehalobacter sp. 4CP]
MSKKENDFFVLMKENAQLICESSLVLKEAVKDPDTFPVKMKELIDLEHRADDITNKIIDNLNKTLVTPMDREDLYSLATNMDDIIDFIQGALERMIMYKAKPPHSGVEELIRVLDDCIHIIKISVDNLPNIRTKLNLILENTEKIHKLESEGDRLYRSEVGKLFENESNPIEIIKWKEILEHLEDATDRCEDLALVIKGVVLKYV